MVETIGKAFPRCRNMVLESIVVDTHRPALSVSPADCGTGYIFVPGPKEAEV